MRKTIDAEDLIRLIASFRDSLNYTPKDSLDAIYNPTARLEQEVQTLAEYVSRELKWPETLSEEHKTALYWRCQFAVESLIESAEGLPKRYKIPVVQPWIVDILTDLWRQEGINWMTQKFTGRTLDEWDAI